MTRNEVDEFIEDNFGPHDKLGMVIIYNLTA